MDEDSPKSPEKLKISYKKKRRHNVAFADFEINDPRSSLLISCTLLFSMSYLFCGIVIPLSDSFITNRETNIGYSYYLEVFLIMQYLVGISCIFYLQLYINIFERHRRKKLKSEMEIKLQEGKKEKELNPGNPNPINDDTESLKVTFDLAQSDNDNLELMANPHINELNMSSFSTHEICNTILYPISDISNNSSSPNSEQISIIHDSEGINLYLRLGAVGFGFGVMMHDGFKIADKFRLEINNCHNHLWTPKQCLHLFYIFVQTFFIFKYHRIIFLKHKPLVRFILYTLITSNICQWFKNVVYEINHELLEHSNKRSKFDNYTISITNCSQQLSYVVSPFLFPCSIEYSLISAAIFYKILQKVGRKNREKYYKAKFATEKLDNKFKYSECHRSHRGLFIGLLFFMVTLVGLAIFFLFKKNVTTKSLSVIVYQFSEIILLVTSIITLITAFIKMRLLKFRNLTEEQALDDNLLLIGLAGVFSYNLFLFISTIDSFVKLKAQKYSLIIILFICKSLTEIIQSCIQVLFVLEGSRKGVQTDLHVRIKPGRSLVTFLIIINLALWIISIFEAKKSDEHLIFNQYSQKTPWSIITHTLLPLIIFFRFHSSICLMDIWSKTYTRRII